MSGCHEVISCNTHVSNFHAAALYCIYVYTNTTVLNSVLRASNRHGPDVMSMLHTPNKMENTKMLLKKLSLMILTVASSN